MRTKKKKTSISPALKFKLIQIAKRQRQHDLEQQLIDIEKENLANEIKKVAPNIRDILNTEYMQYKIEIHHGACMDSDRDAFLLDITMNETDENNNIRERQVGLTWLYSSPEKKK